MFECLPSLTECNLLSYKRLYVDCRPKETRRGQRSIKRPTNLEEFIEEDEADLTNDNDNSDVDEDEDSEEEESEDEDQAGNH